MNWVIGFVAGNSWSLEAAATSQFTLERNKREEAKGERLKKETEI